MLRWTSPEVGESIVDIVLSINKQAQDLHKMDVDVTTYSHVNTTLKNLDEISNKIDEVEGAIKDLEGHAGEYTRGMVNAFKWYTRCLQGDDIPYAKAQREIQQLPSDLISDEKMLGLKEKVDKGLTDFGYAGTLKEKADKWLEDTRIAPEQVTEVAKNFVTLGKKGTLERVAYLPDGDEIDAIKPIKGVFWSGMSVYTGNYKGNLTFNIERPWNEPTFAQVLTHESYPGHQTFYCRWDYLYKQGKLPIEASYYLINSPTNALFEGAPETALHFLGWDNVNEVSPEMPDEAKGRYALARDFLDMQRIAQTNACYMVNVHNASKEDALDYLKTVGLFNTIEAENTYKYFTHPIQKYYYPTYYHGKWIVTRSYDLIPKDKRSDYFKILYDTPQTTDTFIKAVSEFTSTNFNPFID